MKKAYRLFWWNQKNTKGREDLDVLIITDSVDEVFNIFRKEFPGYDTDLIQNIEVMSAKVVVG